MDTTEVSVCEYKLLGYYGAHLYYTILSSNHEQNTYN